MAKTKTNKRGADSSKIVKGVKAREGSCRGVRGTELANKKTTLKFTDLTPGLQPTRVGIYLEKMEGSWTRWSRHDIVYVNQSDNEVVLGIFSNLIALTAEEFDERGYRLVD